MAEIPILSKNSILPQIPPEGQGQLIGTANPALQTSQPTTSLQLPATTIIPGLAKDIHIGEVINFVLRGRTPEGTGLLYMLGQLIKANVPENIAIGDRVQATVEKQGEKLLFKILNIAKINTDSSPLQTDSKPQLTVSISEKLERQISELLHKIAPFLPDNSLQLHAPIQNLKTDLKNITISPQKEIISILTELKNIFLSDKDLTSSAKIKDLIKNVNTPETLVKGKELLAKINSFIATQVGSPENRFFATISVQLKNIASLLDETPYTQVEKVTYDLQKLIKVLSQEIDQESIGKTTKKNFLYFDTIKILRNQLKELLETNKPLTKQNIEKIIDNLGNMQPESKLPTQAKGVNIQELRDLYSLSATLEQYIATSEILSQVDTILNLIKAPELILFPFLFQGLLSFCELAIDPNAHRNKQDKNSKNKNSDEDEQEKSKKVEANIYRYTTSIELPNLGLISLASLQENREIDIQINVEDEEKRNFLNTKLNELKVELNSIGISTRSLTTETLDLTDSLIIEG